MHLSRSLATSDKTDTPKITALRVVPVAGRDSMLLNLSGAHGPFFTRNVVILTDEAGRTGLGEVPGGDQLAGRDLKFVRSALVAKRRYWVWRFTEPDGGMRAYATVSLDPDGTTTLGYGSDDYHLTAEQYILGDFLQVF